MDSSPCGQAVALPSVKSCFGHTEGAAGVTGLLFSATAGQQQLLPPVLCLREINPYVAAALPGRNSAAAAPGAAIPRQPSPHPLAGLSSVAGTSSFGMSGVNAHALVAGAPGPQRALCPAGAAVWELTRYWPTPQAHRLLQLPRMAPGSLRIAAALTATASLGYLWEHAVNGERLMLDSSARHARLVISRAAPRRTAAAGWHGNAGDGSCLGGGADRACSAGSAAPCSSGRSIRCPMCVASAGQQQAGSVGACAQHFQW